MPNLQQRGFIFNYRRIDFERDYGRDYTSPGCSRACWEPSIVLSPKIGPLKPLSFKAPRRGRDVFLSAFKKCGGALSCGGQ